MNRLRTTVLLATLALSTSTLGACTQADESINVGTPEVVAANPELPAGFLDAVEATSLATSYRFETELRVRTATGVADIRLSGSRDPSGRTITVTTDQSAATYVVTGEGATVDRGDGPTPVALSEVPDSPTLRALAGLRDAVDHGDGSFSGTLDGEAIVSGTDVPSQVLVTVRIAAGFVTSLELTSEDGSWTTVTSFRDITA